MGKIGRNVKKCQRYLNEKRRIKNKTEALEKRVKTLTKEEAIEHIKKVCRVGRKKEGFQPEDFKFKKKKKEVPSA
jgi:hypothetical protein